MAAKARIPLTDKSPTSITAPQRHATVTAGSTDLAFNGQYPRVLFCGGAGNVTVMDLDGNSVQYTVPAGYELVMYFQQVTAATATNLVARW